MKVILREDVASLGKLGEVTTVRAGYARNYLFPQGKAERANEEAIKDFERRRAELEKEQQQRVDSMEKARKMLDGYLLQLVARASPDGNLYGSISAQNIAVALNEQRIVEEFPLKRGQVALSDGALKTLGEHSVKIRLRADCEAAITVSILAAADDGEEEEPKKTKQTGRKSEMEKRQ